MADTDISAARELLRDSFTRLIEHVDDLTDGLTDDVATYEGTVQIAGFFSFYESDCGVRCYPRLRVVLRL